MRIRSRERVLCLLLLPLIISCKSEIPESWTATNIYVYSSEYSDSYIGQSTLLLENENNYQAYFGFPPEMRSVDMLSKHEWPQYFFEDRINFGHNEEYQSLSDSQIRSNLSLQRDSLNTWEYEYVSLIDTFDVIELKIEWVVLEWQETESKEIANEKSELQFHKRKINDEFVWIPKKIESQIEIRSSYRQISNYSHKTSLNESSGKVETELDLYNEIGYYPKELNVRPNHKLELSEMKEVLYWGFRESKRISIGKLQIESKGEEMRLSIPKRKIEYNESDLSTGINLRGVVVWNPDGTKIDSLSYHWRMIMKEKPRLTSSTH